MVIAIDVATKWPEVIRMNNNITAERSKEVYDIYSQDYRAAKPNCVR